MKLVISGILPNLNDYIAAERQHRQKGAALKRQAEQVGDGGTCSVCGNLSRCRRNNAPDPVCSRHIKDWLQQPAPEVSYETDT